MIILTAMMCLLVTMNLFSQSITATIGTNGIFTVKNSSTEYFKISQSSGQVNVLKTLRLNATANSTEGVLYFGTLRFMHVYGSNNTFLGENSGNFTLMGPWNTGIGSGVLQNLTTGNANTAFGNGAMRQNTTGNDNTAFGLSSLRENTTGFYNSAFGSNSLSGNVTGEYNSAFGYQSLEAFMSQDSNSAFGSQSLFSNTGGYQNSAFGFFSMGNNSTGRFNTAFGYYAGSNITTGTNLTCLGYNSQPTTGSATNQVTLGNSSVTVLRSAVGTISSLSDMRDKKNIIDLTLGLDFIMTLQPREYNWDKREWYENGVSDGTKMQETPTAGFIAQELDDAQTTAGAEWLNLVLKDNPEKWEATPGNLLPVIVKAVQELNTEIEGTKTVCDELVNKDKEFEERIAKFEEMQNELVNEVEKMKSSKPDNTEIKLGEK